MQPINPKVYVGQGNTLIVSLCPSLDLVSFPPETQSVWGELQECEDAIMAKIEPGAYRILLSTKVYHSKEAKRHVRIKWTPKSDDISAIPQEVLKQLGKLNLIVPSNSTADETIIQKVLTEGYYIAEEPEFISTE
ncbi:hypothetical protein [Spirosoma harenae]